MPCLDRDVARCESSLVSQVFAELVHDGRVGQLPVPRVWRAPDRSLAHAAQAVAAQAIWQALCQVRTALQKFGTFLQASPSQRSNDVRMASVDVLAEGFEAFRSV